MLLAGDKAAGRMGGQLAGTHSEHRFPAPSKDVVNQCLEFAAHAVTVLAPTGYNLTLDTGTGSTG